jgi:hypothetical protein
MARSCRRRKTPIRLNEHIEGGEGAVVFRQACVMIKNPAHPAIERAMLIVLSKRRAAMTLDNVRKPRRKNLAAAMAEPAERAIESAKAAFNDAAQIRLAVETVEAYRRHQKDILRKTEKDGTNVLNCVWCSLFWHLLTLVARAYARPQNKDDLHAKVAVQLLNDPTTRHAAVTLGKGNDGILDDALELWSRCEADPKVQSVITVRNKFIVHWTGVHFPELTVDDVLSAARMTADVLEKLAQGVATPPFDIVDYRDQAEGFWATLAS